MNIQHVTVREEVAMNKYIIGAVIVVVIAVGGFVALNGTDGNSNSQSAIATQPSTPQAETESTETAEVTGYIAYSEANLASTSDTKQVVFFHAPWCSTCNAYEKEIIANGVPEGMTILKADYDSETELKQKYQVRLQSTFVLLDADGNVERSWPFGQGLSNDISNLYDQVI